MAIRKLYEKGHRFQEDSRLSYLRDTDSHVTKSGQKKRRAIFQCSCGNIKEYNFYNVKNGHTKSCGCLNSDLAKERGYSILKKDCLFGVAIIDTDDKDLAKDPIYNTWYHMLSRCFSGKYYHTYENVTVCEEWLKFSEFKKWCLENNHIKGLELDKDLLWKSGNKVYSPESCLLVPRYINMLLVGKKLSRERKYSPGVRKTRNGRYQARITTSGVEQHLGNYKNESEAHKAWQLQKAENVYSTFLRYSEEPFFNSRVAEVLLEKYYSLLLDVQRNKTTYI